MPLTVAQLREMRARKLSLIQEARSITDKAQVENRGLTPEDDVRFNQLFADAESIGKDIEREERLLEAERRSASTEDFLRDQERESRSKTGETETRAVAGDEYRKAFESLLRRGVNRLSDAEIRALSMDRAPEGGFLVAAESISTYFLQAVDDEVFVRRYAHVEQVQGAGSLGFMSLDADPADPDWTSEIQTGSEDSSMSFGKRELMPNALAKRIKVSNKLLNNSARNIGELIAQRLGYKFGIAQEKAFLLGSGANQPLGIFVPHNAGLPVSRDVSNGNTATDLTFDGLIAAKYSLKSMHQKKARWAFHRNGIERIAKIKDADGQYIWQPSKKEGDPDMLLGLPIDMSEYVPNTFTSGKYVGVLANWDCYAIAESQDLQIQVLKELYAESNQTGYIGRMEVDGMPVLAEGFARVKLA